MSGYDDYSKKNCPNCGSNYINVELKPYEYCICGDCGCDLPDSHI